MTPRDDITAEMLGEERCPAFLESRLSSGLGTLFVLLVCVFLVGLLTYTREHQEDLIEKTVAKLTFLQELTEQAAKPNEEEKEKPDEEEGQKLVDLNIPTENFSPRRRVSQAVADPGRRNDGPGISRIEDINIGAGGDDPGGRFAPRRSGTRDFGSSNGTEMAAVRVERSRGGEGGGGGAGDDPEGIGVGGSSGSTGFGSGLGIGNGPTIGIVPVPEVLPVSSWLDDLAAWMRDHPVDLPPAVRRALGYERGDLASIDAFSVEGEGKTSNYVLFIMYREASRLLKVLIVEDTIIFENGDMKKVPAFVFVDRGVTGGTQEYKKGTVSCRASLKQVDNVNMESGGQSLGPNSAEAKKTRQLFASWWEYTKSNA